ncbi:MAG: hypothetical protein WHS38_12300 [Thermodesulforhabdaceae bacterium]
MESVEHRKFKGSWEKVNLDRVAVQDVRTVGAEAVGMWAFDTLEMGKIFRDAGLGEKDIVPAKVLILGKLIHPGSEREIHRWFEFRSALEEIMGVKARDVSLTSLY